MAAQGPQFFLRKLRPEAFLRNQICFLFCLLRSCTWDQSELHSICMAITSSNYGLQYTSMLREKCRVRNIIAFLSRRIFTGLVAFATNRSRRRSCRGSEHLHHPNRACSSEDVPRSENGASSNASCVHLTATQKDRWKAASECIMSSRWITVCVFLDRYHYHIATGRICDLLHTCSLPIGVRILWIRVLLIICRKMRMRTIYSAYVFFFWSCNSAPGISRPA